MKDAYFLGLDLGQKGDYTALATLKRCTVEVDWRKREFDEYQLQHLKRYPLGTKYAAIAESVRRLQLELPEPLKSYVVADTTGVGLPVYEMLKQAGVEDLHGITITGGDAVSREGGIWRVPKRDLVATLQVINQEGLLRAAEGLLFRDVLYAEMQKFRVKINLATGHDSYEAWRERDHDDLVLALAMACWYAENGYEPDDWSKATLYYG